MRNDLSDYKKIAEVAQKAAQQVFPAIGTGVYVAPTAGTTTIYSANSLVTR